jgi:hypothetical protein
MAYCRACRREPLALQPRGIFGCGLPNYCAASLPHRRLLDSKRPRRTAPLHPGRRRRRAVPAIPQPPCPRMAHERKPVLRVRLMLSNMRELVRATGMPPLDARQYLQQHDNNMAEAFEVMNTEIAYAAGLLRSSRRRLARRTATTAIARLLSRRSTSSRRSAKRVWSPRPLASEAQYYQVLTSC